MRLRPISLVAVLAILAMALGIIPGCGQQATPAPTAPPTSPLASAPTATSAPAAATPTKAAATATAPAAAGPAKTLDIGIATPLSGPSAHLGTQIKNAALLAIDDQNAKGGVTIAGQKYTLNPIIMDTKKDAATGKAVAESLVYEKKVKVIVGPFIEDAVAVQAVTEPNKVLAFLIMAHVQGMTGPDKPYSFFTAGPTIQMFIPGAAYFQKTYPEAKKVVSMAPDLADTPIFASMVEKVAGMYGLQWLGLEKFPFGTQDYGPFISRVLAKNPDIVDTNTTGGNSGGLCAVLIKQLREAGYKGFIWVPALPPPGAVEEIVPKEYRYKIVSNDIDWESPIVSDAYRDMCRRYLKKFNETPIDMVGQIYNAFGAFLQFLDGQQTMDTTAWMEGFAKYHWKGIYGKEAFWLGKPIYGIDRQVLRANWVSEYVDGKLQTVWEAPVPMELFTAQ